MRVYRKYRILLFFILEEEIQGDVSMHMEEYRSKCVSADDAVKVIQSGDWVEIAFAASMPGLLDKALARRKDELHDVNLRGGIILTTLACVESDPKGEHFTWNSWHLGGRERRGAKAGWV